VCIRQHSLERRKVASRTAQHILIQSEQCLSHVSTSTLFIRMSEAASRTALWQRASSIRTGIMHLDKPLRNEPTINHNYRPAVMPSAGLSTVTCGPLKLASTLSCLSRREDFISRSGTFVGSVILHRYLNPERTLWRRWLRHCVTIRKVAGSIPDGVIGIFH
jgi:hypothetical protein